MSVQSHLLNLTKQIIKRHPEINGFYQISNKEYVQLVSTHSVFVRQIIQAVKAEFLNKTYFNEEEAEIHVIFAYFKKIGWVFYNLFTASPQKMKGEVAKSIRKSKIVDYSLELINVFVGKGAENKEFSQNNCFLSSIDKMLETREMCKKICLVKTQILIGINMTLLFILKLVESDSEFILYIKASNQNRAIILKELFKELNKKEQNYFNTAKIEQLTREVAV